MLKILCEFQTNAWMYQSRGWENVFKACGHDFRYHYPQQAVFDSFAFEPDIYIGRTHLVDRAVIKNITSRPNLKVCMSAGHAGPIEKDKGNLDLFITPESERKLIAELREKTGRPNFVFAHFPEKYIPYGMSGWEKIGVPVKSLLHAADTFIYYPGQFKEELSCDMSIVSGSWGWKAVNLRPYLYPLFDKYKWKIFGNQGWEGIPQFLGFIDDSLVRDLFASSKILPNIAEPQATLLPTGENNERTFKVCYSGGFCLSDPCPAAQEMMKGKLVMATDPKDFYELASYYMKNEKERNKIAKECQLLVAKEHTYFDRVAYMLQELGFIKESEKVLEKKNGFVVI